MAQAADRRAGFELPPLLLAAILGMVLVRMVIAAGDRPCIEMGSRRTHEDSAMASARAAYVAGFASTSNVAAGKVYGIAGAEKSVAAFLYNYAGKNGPATPVATN